MGKSVYDCYICDGKAVLKDASFGLKYHWQRECDKCGMFSGVGESKREANELWKTGELRRITGPFTTIEVKK